MNMFWKNPANTSNMAAAAAVETASRVAPGRVLCSKIQPCL
jgi:hypothetical protein